VLAYAVGQPLHELAGGRPGGPFYVLATGRADALVMHHAMHEQPGDDVAAPAAHLQHRAAHAWAAGAGHGMQVRPGAAHDAPGAPGAPTAPHCPFCLDFAAGAALAPLGIVVPAPHVSAVAPLPVPERVIAARASLRLAPPRGPPLLG